MREGHQSEVLLSIAEEFPADLCFTLVFHGRQGNLDLVADSPEEAQAWIQGVRKLIHKTQTMDEKERLDQYPFTVGHHSVHCLMNNSVSSPVFSEIVLLKWSRNYSGVRAVLEANKWSDINGNYGM